MTSGSDSRYWVVSRRRFLQASAAGGVLALFPGLACTGSGDSVTSTPASPSTEPAGGETTASPPESTAPGGSSIDLAVPLEAELVIAFSYTPDTSDRIESPYIAVWIEDSDGNLVRTLLLWFKADERKYLRDLPRWSDIDGETESAVVSGATRIPGAHSVVWDGVAADGASSTTGDYHVCIEAAREDGPYQLIRQTVTLDGRPLMMPLPQDGELTDASVVLNV